jgi:hypothetical protein
MKLKLSFEFWVLDEIDNIEKKEKTLGEEEIICLLYKEVENFLYYFVTKKEDELLDKLVNHYREEHEHFD